MSRADEFARIFREEHRVVRDALLELIAHFEERNGAKAMALLGKAAAFVGPHFRYEEEAMYPALVEIFGRSYVNDLLDAHDGAVASAKRLVEILGSPKVGDEQAKEAVRLLRGILPHVGDCDGLSLMVERLPEAKVEAIFQARERAQLENVDLLRWANEVRRRPEV